MKRLLYALKAFVQAWRNYNKPPNVLRLHVEDYELAIGGETERLVRH